MEALQAILTRKVVRAFLDRQVEPEKLRKIVDAGRHAMSARNLQPWAFIVIRDRDRLRELAQFCLTGRFVADAPAAIIVLKDLNNKRWADIDCAQAVQNMANAGWAMDLGTCWVGNLEKEKISEKLEVPHSLEVFTVLPFGYFEPAQASQPKRLKPASGSVFYERFGQERSQK